MPKGRRSPATRLAKAGFKSPNNSANRTIYGDPETKPPQNVASDPFALEIWQRTVETLIASGTWQASDRHAVERYSVAQACCIHCEKAVLEGDIIQTTKTGYTQISGAMCAYAKAAKIAEGCEKQLGISVDARRALSLANAPEADELDRFLAENP